ncbi:hypothetical protein [uncultured Methanobrevibacter sp.]|uniref:hypothetical protein n=1 Tax=uncultured Methanobrevibacter sp. TaxID=253161 RepID=UPI0025DAC668|nr:hypothetical protein [uncultured Methanobrevibacter sp.]
MAFTDEDFIDLMNFCKDLNNFHKSAKKPFDSINNISRSDGRHNIPLIADYRYWFFNLDNICFNTHITDSGRVKKLPASTDGLHIGINNSKLKLYFIEFKGLPINSIDYKLKLKAINKSLRKGRCANPQENCPLSEEVFKSLNNAKSRFEDEINCQLKIKTTESLFFTLPEIYRYYCEKNEISYEENLDDFIAWLLKSKKNFIVVFDDETELSPANRQFSFKNRLRDKFNHFRGIANITPSVVEKSLFEKKCLHKHFDRIDFPSYTTVDYIEFLNKNFS